MKQSAKAELLLVDRCPPQSNNINHGRRFGVGYNYFVSFHHVNKALLLEGKPTAKPILSVFEETLDVSAQVLRQAGGVQQQWRSVAFAVLICRGCIAL